MKSDLWGVDHFWGVRGIKSDLWGVYHLASVPLNMKLCAQCDFPV